MRTELDKSTATRAAGHWKQGNYTTGGAAVVGADGGSDGG